MNILVIGSGGREHALCWAISKSTKCKNLYCIPGNAGIEEIARCYNLDPSNKKEIYNFCNNYLIEFVVIGPEVHLEEGLSNYLISKNLKVFGPSKEASRLETSKVFSKKFLKKNKIPTGDSEAFNNLKDSEIHIKSIKAPYVIKVDGLAAGKGVIICKTENKALKTLNDIFIKNKYGKAGRKIIIEEFLEGFEISYFSFFDKDNILTFTYALDHKKAKNGDRGLNTGGMGAFTPSQKVSKKLENKILKQIILPTKKGLKNENIIYRGIIFFGLMITKHGPKVIEYNVRFGDPECQTILRNCKFDLLELLHATSTDSLKGKKVLVEKKNVICVVLASIGYPEKYKKGKVINGIDKAKKIDGVEIFHSGTIKENNKFLSNGGRVLSVTAKAKTIKLAREKAYEALKKINWKGGFYRNDIGIKNFK